MSALLRLSLRTIEVAGWRDHAGESRTVILCRERICCDETAESIERF
jgi:hypothetical protein